jgi:hypothetical protein
MLSLNAMCTLQMCGGVDSGGCVPVDEDGMSGAKAAGGIPGKS